MVVAQDLARNLIVFVEVATLEVATLDVVVAKEVVYLVVASAPSLNLKVEVVLAW